MSDVIQPYDMTPSHATAVLHAYVTAAVLDKTGRPLADRSRLLALDALQVLATRQAA